jgi:hypothetical protein
MKTIPYHLFKNKRQRKIRSSEYQEFYQQLVNIYANRHYYDDKLGPIDYLYSSETNRPCEIIEAIDEKFVYEYLLKHSPDCLKLTDGSTITFEEYMYAMETYYTILKDYLYEGIPVSLPHFLGIIKIKTKVIQKFNRIVKKYLPKKIITLHWENKFFVNRLLNVVNPNWFSIKIKDKELLNKIYNNMVEKSHLYEVSFGINFYKKIR